MPGTEEKLPNEQADGNYDISPHLWEEEFLIFNILIFENKLPDAEVLIDVCVEANVDAIIVQDLELVKIIRDILSDFRIMVQHK